MADDEPGQPAPDLPLELPPELRPDPPPDAAPTWHSLPGSARLGDWMHQSLEWLQAEGFPAQPTPAHMQRLARTATLAGLHTQAPVLQQWLAHILHTPLPLPAPLPEPAAAPRLGQLHRTLSELEFWLPVQQEGSGTNTTATALDALCHSHIWPDQPRPRLGPRQWQGMLMGFADLVFEHAGRYWVLDYKTNRLGDGAHSYALPALRHAMLQHRYDLQAALYLYALHRLLRVRLPHYLPQQHLGGALYWFVRGIDHPDAGLLHIPACENLLQSLDQALGVHA